MLLIGVTGGVGMGKSTTAGFLAQNGVAVVDTDLLARELVAPGQPALAEIASAFGPDVLAADGALDRGQLARRVFADEAARRRLEAILHPRIRAAWLAQAAAWRTEGRTAGAVIIPLLYETASEKELGPVICTACTAATQRSRLKARGWDEAQIAGRLAAQWPVEQKLALADFVAWSEGALDTHAAQVRRILGAL
ncbi:MAG: dephospho-CoA kinase [Limisphaerales bacterium]